jgi:5-methyltetrahydrofolate--homocysteine methyltransferase
MALGRRELATSTCELARYIDGGRSSGVELSGPFPAIPDDPVVGEAARTVHAEGQAMLKRIVEGCWFHRKRRGSLLPATIGDDIEMYTDESRSHVALTWHNLRQQNERPPGKPNYCLADFVGPKGSGVNDYVGAFAVTSGLGIEKKVGEFEAAKDDYSAIMLKALADRLAEAFASGCTHEGAPRAWGMRKRDARAFRDDSRGVPRHPPRPSYPACPDHAVKGPLFDLLRRDLRSACRSPRLRDAAGGVGLGFLHRAPDARPISRSARWAGSASPDFARRKAELSLIGSHLIGSAATVGCRVAGWN